MELMTFKVLDPREAPHRVRKYEVVDRLLALKDAMECDDHYTDEDIRTLELAIRFLEDDEEEEEE